MQERILRLRSRDRKIRKVSFAVLPEKRTRVNERETISVKEAER